MQGNRSEEMGGRRGKNIGESVGSTDRWMDIQRDQNLKSEFDKCRVETKLKGKGDMAQNEQELGQIIV